MNELTGKDLMVGDWVMLTDPINNGEKVQVKEIHGDGYITVVGGITKMYEPISLTDEILEKNGWSYSNEDAKYAAGTWVGNGLMLQENGVGYRIVVVSDYDDEDTNYTQFVITDIHQLQHALRMAGIDKTIEL